MPDIRLLDDTEPTNRPVLIQPNGFETNIWEDLERGLVKRRGTQI